MSLESLVIWLVLGAISGWLAGKILQGSGFGLLGNIILGVLGSIIGGWLGGILGISGATTGGLSLASILTAVIGAIVLIYIVGLVNGKKT